MRHYFESISLQRLSILFFCVCVCHLKILSRSIIFHPFNFRSPAVSSVVDLSLQSIVFQVSRLKATYLEFIFIVVRLRDRHEAPL